MQDSFKLGEMCDQYTTISWGWNPLEPGNNLNAQCEISHNTGVSISGAYINLTINDLESLGRKLIEAAESMRFQLAVLTPPPQGD